MEAAWRGRAPAALRHHRHERRAVALDAGEVEVARSSDRCGSCGRTACRRAARDRQLLLSPQSPQPSHTRSLITTRTPGVGDRAALADAALLGGAALVVDQHGAPRHRRERLLGLDDAASVPHLRRRRGNATPAVLLGLVGGDRSPRLHAFERAASAPGSGTPSCAVRVLATGHRHRAVVEELVRDVRRRWRPRRARRACRSGRTCRHRCSGRGARRSTNGAMPNHCAPSLPIAVRPTTSPTRSASISTTIEWQPMPPPTSASLGRPWWRCCAGNPSRSTACG